MLFPTSSTDFQGTGGANRDRTDDLLNAIQALSQLSYGPIGTIIIRHRPSDGAYNLREKP